MKKRRPIAPANDEAHGDPDLARLSSAVELATLTAFDRERAQALYGDSGPAKPVRVVIDVDSARGDEARRIAWGDGQRFRSAKDGGVSVEFVCNDFAPVIARVLRFGSHAQVRAPKTLIEHVVRTLDATLAAYKK